MTETAGKYVQIMREYSHNCSQHCFGVVTMSSNRRHLKVRALKSRELGVRKIYKNKKMTTGKIMHHLNCTHDASITFLLSMWDRCAYRAFTQACTT